MDHHAIPPSSSPPPADRATAQDIGGVDPPRAATAQLRIRPVVPGDADGLRALHTAASNQSLYLRFFGYSRTPSRSTSRCCPDRPAGPTRR